MNHISRRFTAQTLTLTLLAAAIVSAGGADPGQTIVDTYLKAKPEEQRPGGGAAKCYAVSYARVNAGLVAACGAGAALPSLTAFQPFDRLWGSKTDPTNTWLKINAQYRGKGAPGALALQGLAEIVDQEGIWNGKLKPGAVLQTWAKRSDFDDVAAGKAPTGIGHSFIFLEYVKDSDGSIVGMKIADQGTGWAQPHVLKQATFEYWVGGNLNCPK